MLLILDYYIIIKIGTDVLKEFALVFTLQFFGNLIAIYIEFRKMMLRF